MIPRAQKDENMGIVQRVCIYHTTEKIKLEMDAAEYIV